MRHPIAAELGHAEVQRAGARIARLDDAGVAAARSRRAWDGRRPPSSRRAATGNCSRRLTDPPPPFAVAVAAVGVEIGPRPRLQRLARVRRVGELALPSGRGGIERGSGLPSFAARRMSPASVRATSWLRPSGPGRFNCSGWNARAYSDQLLWHDMHWLRLWNLPDALLLSNPYFLLDALGGDQVGVRLIVPPGERVGAPVHAVEVQELRLQTPASQGEGPHQHRVLGEVHAEIDASPRCRGSACRPHRGWRTKGPERRPSVPPSRRPAIAGCSPRTGPRRRPACGP